MASVIQRTHNRWLDNHPDAVNAWGKNHARNFPLWIKQSHPAAFATTDPTRIPTGYLQDLYPHLWAYGPRGDIYMAQLDRIETLLDEIANGAAYNDFLDAINRHLANLDAIYISTTIMGDLIAHAAATGLPLPGDDILYGSDPAPLPPGERHPIEYLTAHIVWSEFRDDAAPFKNFIYNFALLSVHHAFFASHAAQHAPISEFLDYYNAFCDAWGIPR